MIRSHGLAARLLGILLGIVPLASSAQEWGYLGDTGPEHWGSLAPAFELCELGREQSPVDLHPGTPRAFRRVAIEYGETEGEIFNNGHTIEVETHGANRLEIDGISYQLVQFHFHTPSEHRSDGRGHDAELHLVHRSASGMLAVVGVQLQRAPGRGALAAIFESLPDDVGVHHELDERFDPSRFLPRSRAHRSYRGSLTTPPCSEGVRWIVMDDPVGISDEHMAQLVKRISFNARPVQRELPRRIGHMKKPRKSKG